MIGNRIYELRRSANLSQEQLAEKIDVSRQTISNWENNQTVPDLYQASSLAQALNLQIIDELFTNTKNINWEQVTENLKSKIQSIVSNNCYTIWFSKLQYCSYNNGTITFSVPMEIHKAMLKKTYNDLMIDAINELADNVDKINYIVEE